MSGMRRDFESHGFSFNFGNVRLKRSESYLLLGPQTSRLCPFCSIAASPLRRFAASLHGSSPRGRRSADGLRQFPREPEADRLGAPSGKKAAALLSLRWGVNGYIAPACAIQLPLPCKKDEMNERKRQEETFVYRATMVVAGEIRTRLVEYGKFKIVIMDAPCDENSHMYVRELKQLGVTDVVRTCEPTYSPELFEREGIEVHEMTFPDGAAPPEELIQKWNGLICQRYRPKDPADTGVVAVHCVAGLGRAPVMAAVALIEMTAMDPMDAVEKIRERQKGAINARQLKFLQSYKPMTKPGPMGPCNCTVVPAANPERDTVHDVTSAAPCTPRLFFRGCPGSKQRRQRCRAGGARCSARPYDELVSPPLLVLKQARCSPFVSSPSWGWRTRVLQGLRSGAVRQCQTHQRTSVILVRQWVPERENTGSPRIAAPFFPFVGRVAVLMPKDTLKEAISNMSVTDIVGNMSASDLFAARTRRQIFCISNMIR
eukprot:s932_g13.t4